MGPSQDFFSFRIIGVFKGKILSRRPPSNFRQRLDNLNVSESPYSHGDILSDSVWNMEFTVGLLFRESFASSLPFRVAGKARGLRKVFNANVCLKAWCIQSWARKFCKALCLNAMNWRSLFPVSFFPGKSHSIGPATDEIAWYKALKSVYLFWTFQETSPCSISIIYSYYNYIKSWSIRLIINGFNKLITVWPSTSRLAEMLQVNGMDSSTLFSCGSFDSSKSDISLFLKKTPLKNDNSPSMSANLRNR